jgi:hypothetical protein
MTGAGLCHGRSLRATRSAGVTLHNIPLVPDNAGWHTAIIDEERLHVLHLRDIFLPRHSGCRFRNKVTAVDNESHPDVGWG